MQVLKKNQTFFIRESAGGGKEGNRRKQTRGERRKSREQTGRQLILPSFMFVSDLSTLSKTLWNGLTLSKANTMMGLFFFFYSPSCAVSSCYLFPFNNHLRSRKRMKRFSNTVLLFIFHLVSDTPGADNPRRGRTGRRQHPPKVTASRVTVVNSDGQTRTLPLPTRLRRSEIKNGESKFLWRGELIRRC